MIRAIYVEGSSPLARGLPSRRRRSARWRRDHPRSRGVYGDAPFWEVRVDRIIPARAGFTRGRLLAAGPGPDHPRSRGVYPLLPAHPLGTAGSSPLARGLPDARHARVRPRRIIPARAGFTRHRCRRRRRSGDHPRSRGVYRVTREAGPSPAGSSPLARGLPVPRQEVVQDLRIIPARAGFTVKVWRLSDHLGDHPRSRGVYIINDTDGKALTGSSPLARGLRQWTQGRAYDLRIIPARAGFTPDPPRQRRHVGDHPRSRGVYPFAAECGRQFAGSSPLARGLPNAARARWRCYRIIPARAGFTCVVLSCTLVGSDHPRSRGVYTGGSVPRRWMEGSSPLARGLLHAPKRVGCTSRIIPARAGFTPRPRGPLRARVDHPRSRGVY